MSIPAQADRRVIEPTRYHQALLAFLRTEEKEIWDWIASQKVRAEYAQTIRHELLKSTYRIDPAASPQLYQLAKTAAEGLAHIPITLYQAQNAQVLNASLAWLPGEVHVVLHGPVQETLTDPELLALFGHEVAHHCLFSVDGGAYLIVEQVLSAMLGDRQASPAHQQTWKRFKLYTELFCDRTTLNLTSDLATCVSTLVKMETGLKNVSAEAYLKQAEEVLQNGTKGSEGTTHPEMFIRAHALQLWTLDRAQVDRTLESIIEGPLTMGAFDLLRQTSVSQSTRAFIEHFLAPHWMQTNIVLAHAKQFFEDFDGTHCVTGNVEDLKAALAAGDDQFRDYFCYVLLDFATTDVDLEEAPFAAALLLGRQLDIEDRFLTIAGKELQMSKRQIESIRKNAADLVAEAEKQHLED